MISTYKKDKENVLEAYREFLKLIALVKDGKQTSYDASLESLAKQAEKIEQEKFLLVVAGEAKSGKSTFINAYLGEEILPMDVKQCTSSIVEIRYGEKFILKATYADDRVKVLEDKQRIQEFLTANAALDDDYRDIPVSLINFGLLMRKKDRPISESEILDLLKGIESANLYHLPKDEYENKVRDYIKKRQPVWRDIIKKIEIEYPFADVDMRGITIVDTPGVNADGRVGDITNKYIEKANAVMFLKSLVGQALEQTSFREFFESISADRNRNAMFLILTSRAALKKKDIIRQQEDVFRLFPEMNSQQIIFVDSKVKLFFNIAQNLTDKQLQDYITELNEADELDDFIFRAWSNAGEKKEPFLERLKELSNFTEIDEALNQFSYKAPYLVLRKFLECMLPVMEKVMDSLEDDIDWYNKKAKNLKTPIELEKQISRIKQDIETIIQQMNSVVDTLPTKYSGSEGRIQREANTVMAEYEREINSVKASDPDSLEQLEKITFRRIDKFTEFVSTLQKDIVAECDKTLISLSNKCAIRYSTLKPDFTEETFKKIIDDMRDSDESKEFSYTSGTTFTKAHEESHFSQPKFFNAVKKNIILRLQTIKHQAIEDLGDFVNQIVNLYMAELIENKDRKIDELNNLVQKKQTAEEIQDTINELEFQLNQLKSIRDRIEILLGGIKKYV